MATLGRCLGFISNNSVHLMVRNSCLLSRNIPNVRKFSRISSLLSEKRFSEKHEWVTVDGEIGTIGISDYAQEALGDIVYAQLPDVDTEFDQDDECGALESVKAASELYTPVSGTVTEKNGEVEETPALINKNPYDKGWLFKVKLSNPSEVDDLMTEEKYEAFLKEQAD